eukprot:GHRR01019816.1.p1 GENE.GHRR01019816.1~~GHRR01019816.1.p1  ORF type:complete len:362 (+),score=96.49 GHRR01019816.1:34-1086(+)
MSATKCCHLQQVCRQGAIPALCSKPTFIGRNTIMPCAAVAQKAPVLVSGNELGQGPASPQTLLAENKQWSYTTALVRHHYHVVDWHLHVERLVRNMQVLGKQHPPRYSAFLHWLEQQPSPADAVTLLQQLINPRVALVLHQLQGSRLSQDANGQNEAMLVVVLRDPHQPPQDVIAGSLPPLEVLVWSNVHAAANSKPGKVLVAGDPRPLALAKHCNWVVARRPLEALKAQANADEVVLSNTSGALLEGLASNFFVVADMAQLTGIRTMDSNATANGATANRASSAERVNGTGSGTDDLVLLTTGAAHAALQGITQRRVLEAAASIGLQVVEQPAGPNQQHAWREAFISNW